MGQNCLHYTDALNAELQHLKEALVRCKCPRWPINKVQNKVINDNQEDNGNNHVGNILKDTSTSSSNNQTPTTSRGRPSMGHIVIPYVQGLGESIKHTCIKYGIQTYSKGNRSIKQMLVRPKDQDLKEKKSGVIYSYQCGAIDCGEEYIGETSSTLGERYKEHLREPSLIQVHIQSTGHQFSQDNFNIIGRDSQDLTRLIKESIYIRVNTPTLNRNIGRF